VHTSDAPRLTVPSLTCRKRRVKCDEALPHCNNCERVGRDCVYPEKSASTPRPRALSARKSSAPPAGQTIPDGCASSTNIAGLLDLTPVSTSGGIQAENTSQSWLSFPTVQPKLSTNELPDETFFLDDSLFTFDDPLTAGFGPVEWYDLLAEDAINNMQGQAQSSRWNFDITTLSRRQSPRQSPVPPPSGLTFDGTGDAQPVVLVHKPWNTESAIELKQEELVYFEHFINVVAPMMDLFDSGRHFATAVPHLALRNVGLFKAVLAVGASHLGVLHYHSLGGDILSPIAANTPGSTTSAPSSTSRIAEQYYYETLQYLSQNLLYHAYTISHELLATAIMISTYEVSRLHRHHP
jgi:hypothetical protein